MRSTAVNKLVKPSLVIRLASPADYNSAFPDQGAAGKRKARTRPRGDGRGGVVSEVGLAAASLLPPLPLYRRILRVHRALPVEMKSLGDQYVKDEFRRHRTVDNPLQIVGFLTQWKIYLDGLENQTGTAFKGRQLDMQHFEKVCGLTLCSEKPLLTSSYRSFPMISCISFTSF